MYLSLKRFAGQASTAVTLSLISVQNALASFGTIPTVSGTTNDIRTTVIKILSAILNLMALAAVAVIIFAGIRLVIVGADESQREKSRNTILYAVVGLIVILLAQAIVKFVEDQIAN